MTSFPVYVLARKLLILNMSGFTIVFFVTWAKFCLVLIVHDVIYSYVHLKIIMFSYYILQSVMVVKTTKQFENDDFGSKITYSSKKRVSYNIAVF